MRKKGKIEDVFGMLAGKTDVKPVSYTHLDVYKRQEQDCIIGFPDGRPEEKRNQ